MLMQVLLLLNRRQHCETYILVGDPPENKGSFPRWALQWAQGMHMNGAPAMVQGMHMNLGKSLLLPSTVQQRPSPMSSKPQKAKVEGIQRQTQGC